MEGLSKLDNKLENAPLPEIRDMYLSYSEKDRLNDDWVPWHHISMLRKAIAGFYSDEKEINTCLKRWSKMFNYKIDDDYITPSLLDHKFETLSEDDLEDFRVCIDGYCINKNIENSSFRVEDIEKGFENIIKNYADLPLTKYILAKKNKVNNWKNLISECPKYNLFRLEDILQNENIDLDTNLDFSFLGKHSKISNHEGYLALLAMLKAIKKNKSLEQILAFDKFLKEKELYYEEESIISWKINIEKIFLIEEYMQKNVQPKNWANLKIVR